MGVISVHQNLLPYMTYDALQRFLRALLCIYLKRRLCSSMDEIDGRIIQLIILELFTKDNEIGDETDFDLISDADIFRFSGFHGCPARVKLFRSLFQRAKWAGTVLEYDSESEYIARYFDVVQELSAESGNVDLLTKDKDDKTWCRNCLLKFDKVFCARKEKWIFARKRCTRCQQVFCGKQCFKRAWNFGNHKLKCLKHL